MVEPLNKKWKELLFSFSGFGPNLLMVLMGAYFTDAVNPAALGSGSYQSIMGGVCLIMPGLFSVLYMLARVFDGIIDIPFAHISDTLSTKWGRRRPTIALAFVPMVVSFAMCWLPIGGSERTFLNTIWISTWLLVFFASYTMCLISFYGSLSTTCTSGAQRLRVSSFKSFFDTLSYCFVYALVPLLLEVMRMRIDRFVLLLLPLMLTMIIPLFMIKEGEKYGYPEDALSKGKKLKLVESVALTFKNRVFANWLIVNCCTYFGLQMFLVAMNAMIIGGMGFNGTEMAIINTSAFAPIPLMLYLFKKLKQKKGVRYTFQSCLIAFAVAILSFFFGSRLICGDGNKSLQLIIGCVGGVCGSWAIGSFFMMPYLAAAQISGVEEQLTGKNHSAMYFAGNAVVSSIVGALASLLYESIKMLYFAKDASSVVYAASYEEAEALLGVAQGASYNLGLMLVPFVVCLVCIAGAVLAFRLPKDFSASLIAKEFKKSDPSLDISKLLSSDEDEAEKEEQEILFVQVALCVLTIFVYGFIWVGYLGRAITREVKLKKFVAWLLCCFVPFAGLILLLRSKREMGNKGGWLMVVLGVLIPLLPLNLPLLALAQHRLNRASAT